MSDTGFDETPDITASLLKEFADSGFVNIAGGCCGTTPDHIREIANTVASIAPRSVPTHLHQMKLSGLESFTIDEDSLFLKMARKSSTSIWMKRCLTRSLRWHAS
jgi:5-methyltetrahydrofolate--homocysteine methyltransferase